MLNKFEIGDLIKCVSLADPVENGWITIGDKYITINAGEYRLGCWSLRIINDCGNLDWFDQSQFEKI